MTPIDWALLPLKKYADFSGRAPRAEYWWYAVASGILGGLMEFVDGPLGGPVVGVYGPVSLMVTFGLLIPGLAVTVRRLHDIGRSGWWALLNGASYVFVAAGLLMSSPEQMFESSRFQGFSPGALIAIVLVWLGIAITMLVFMVTQGTKGTNGYGPDPYGELEDLEAVFS